MKIQTLSILVGTEACNAKCPYCISQMTPEEDLTDKLEDINWRNLGVGIKYAKQNDVSTVLLTGKGEPTLYPNQVTEYLKHLNQDFPFIEMQTNGLIFQEQPEKYKQYLKEWYDLGMTTVALSIAHYDNQKNKEIYTPFRDYPDLGTTIEMLHDAGMSVRLSCIMAKDYIDDIEGLEKLVEFAKDKDVEQLTIRGVEKPKESRNDCTSKWVENHYINQETINGMRDYLDKNGTRLMELVHGAIVYDYKDQNICLSNCLTINAKDEKIRQLIFCPDGHLRYDWQHKGAILL